MRFFRLALFFLLIVSLGCQDYSRAGFNMPPGESIAENFKQDQILDELSDYIRSNPGQYLGYFKRAVYFYENEKYAEALEDISQSERISPNSGEILYYKSLIQYQLGDKNALNNARFAEDEGYDFPELYTLMAKLYLKEGEPEKASEYIIHAENLYPYNSDIFFVKGDYYAYLGDTITSIHHFKKALELNPGKFEYYDGLTKLYASYRLIDSAYNLNEKAIVLFPDKSQLQYNKAYIYEKSGIPEKAIQSYQKYLKLEPEKLEIYDRIGNIYLRNKNYTAAIKTYEKWVAAEPENPEIRLKVAKAYVSQMNYYPARTYLEQSLEKFPDNKNLEKELSSVNYWIDLYKDRTPRPENKRNSDQQEELERERIFHKNIEIKKIPERETIKSGSGSNE